MPKTRPFAKVLTGARHVNPTRADAELTDALSRIGKRVAVMGQCWVVDGEPDVYPTLGGRTRRAAAHRYVYCEVHEVVVPSEVHIHHTCEHPGCIRPDHLVALDAGDHARVHAGTVELDAVVIPPGQFQ